MSAKRMTNQQRANIIAWRAGYGRATRVVFGYDNIVISHTPRGYRKFSDGQYVSNAYRNNFGWKNTYYQEAETVVMLFTAACPNRTEPTRATPTEDKT